MRQARGLAETARSQLAAGIDPIKERRRLKREALQSANTFEHLAYEAFEGRKGKTSDFRVPLTPEALHVIELASQQQRDGYIFPGVKRGVISDASMARLMERRGLDARPHGFRSTLRVWLTESQQASREVAETIIAHQTGSLTERAYNHTDFLEQRRELMEAWAGFLGV